MSKRKYKWKKIMLALCWLAAGIGTVVLLGAARQYKDKRVCSDVAVWIKGADKHMFIDEKEVMTILNAMGKVTGSPIAALNLRVMETVVEKNPWVRNAEMYLDNNQVLQVIIDERQPVARVFTMEGTSFYLDSGALRLPLSDKLSARVPVFTGFPSDRAILSAPDSALLHQIVKLGKYVLADSFWMAQVAQIDITPQSNFELVPVFGNHLIAMGNTDSLGKKFNRLYTFYQKAWLQNGIDTYERLDVQYENQVVAIKKGMGKQGIDSARAKEAMKSMLDWAQASKQDTGFVAAIETAAITKSILDTPKIAKAIIPSKKINAVEISKPNSTKKSNNKEKH